jgi:hypothetical protein
MADHEIIAIYIELLSTQKLKSKIDFHACLFAYREILFRDFPHDTKNFEQSWRKKKGTALEQLVKYALSPSLSEFGLKLAQESDLTANNKNDSFRNLYWQVVVDFGIYKKHLPDSDLIVYQTEPTLQALAILSVKSSLRERIAQAAYWKRKLKIPYYLITADYDNDFGRDSITKSRAIAEADTDGVYVISENPIRTSDRVKHFGELIEDLRKLIQD